MHGRMKGGTEGQLLALGDLGPCKCQCHLVLVAASRDLREWQCFLLVNRLFMAPLNKHKIPH